MFDVFGVFRFLLIFVALLVLIVTVKGEGYVPNPNAAGYGDQGRLIQ